jgi:hypothetical protein
VKYLALFLNPGACCTYMYIISMGQLDVYSLEDTYLITIFAGPLSSYFTAEAEDSIESIVAYIYSTNVGVSKKRIKIIKTAQYSGDIAGEIHLSWRYLQLNDVAFTNITRPLNARIMWQDPALSK